MAKVRLSERQRTVLRALADGWALDWHYRTMYGGWYLRKGSSRTHVLTNTADALLQRKLIKRVGQGVYAATAEGLAALEGEV